MAIDLKKLDTERRNPATANIDSLSTLDMTKLINSEDRHCAEAVEKVLPQVAQSIDIIYEKIRTGGRLFYAGAGTSGRLGVLDAAECPPTYGVDPGLVVGLIAGGPPAFLKAVEGAEDSAELGRTDLIEHQFSANDALVGIAASGRTPYVIGAMDYARSLGAPVIALTCCRNSEMSCHADITIDPVPGPEVVTGSSRMKSGTCQKLVLNMLSTCVMIKMGKVYGNLMVDVQATNQKLVRRAISIVCAATGASEDTAQATLKQCGFSCKTAIVMLLLNLDAEAARTALRAADGRIAQAVGMNKENR
ncbi:MAG: N-acetylmuramic acid 6-phosphate etherase [Clostridia bacterium]|nr:N-acetylmuramic acid 6-phosphate etherase [Clostridia bacterium]